MAKRKLVAASKIPFTRRGRYAAAAKLIRRAIETLKVAEAMAPEGECRNLWHVIEPHAEAMERGAATAVDDGTVSYPVLPLD